MRKIITVLVFLAAIVNSTAQELNCLVTVNSDQVAGSNQQVFKTLERSLTEFINQTKWTDKVVQPEERIDCAMTIIVTSRTDNQFTATLQIQSTRPVFNTTYTTTLLNIKDNEFNFKYNEFDPLFYNKNQFDSNLVSTIVFYVYTVLGIDADSFAPYGGSEALKEAQNVMLQAQQSGIGAWQNVVGKQNRFLLIDNLLSTELSAYRKALYAYHKNGLDNLVSSKANGQQNIENSIISLDAIYNKTISNYLIRLFFDAKTDEILNLYSEKTSTRQKSKLLTVLNKIASNRSAKWRKLN